MKTVRTKNMGWRAGLLCLSVLAMAAVLVTLWYPHGASSAADWTAPQDISHSTYGTYSPEMVLDSQGYTHAVWWGDGETSSDWSVWYANNRSGNWSTPVRISPRGDIRAPKIAISANDELHVVYEDRGPSEIMYTYSTDYGVTWSSRQNISNTSAKAYEPSVWVDPEGNVHAVWIDSRWLGSPLYQTTYAKRTAGTWSAPIRPQSSIRFNKAPKVTTTGTGSDLRVHISFYGKNADTDPNYAYDTYYMRGTGTSWEGVTRISDGTDQASYDPDIAASGPSSLFILWDETPPSSYHDIYMKSSTDNGASWSSSRQIIVNSNLSRFPSAAFAQSRLQIVFDDNSAGSGDVFYTYYDPTSGVIGPLINLAATSGESKEGDIVGNTCRLAVAWMDKGTVWTILYTTTPTTPPGPCPSATATPTAFTPSPTPSPTPTMTPSPTPTPDPRPHGWVDIIAHDPAYDHDFTRSLLTSLQLYAASDVGATVTDMLVCNVGECPQAVWVPYVEWIADWPLVNSTYDCEYKYVQAQFRDDVGRTSPTYADVIQYDNYLTASMQLNGGLPYTSRTLVAVESEDIDGQQPDCTGLEAMRLRESPSLTYTVWISYFPKLYFFLAPDGPMTRTVEAEYRDRAHNFGVLSDSITMDLLGPVGTAPTLNNGISSTTKILVPVSGLEATDPSGILNIWLANRPDGPWQTYAYCADPPCSYTWNLGYGGPPIQYPDLHTVYVMYEDGAGYGSLPGNLSAVYTGTVFVHDISTAFLPILFRDWQRVDGLPTPGQSDTASLVLMADRQEVAPGEEVLLYLAARREASTPLVGTLRMSLPAGLKVLQAWSAYGQVLSVDDSMVTSRERAWSGQTPWILVHARVEGPAGSALQVQGDLSWDNGSLTASPVWIENR
jgi:hypothetical protein